MRVLFLFIFNLLWLTSVEAGCFDGLHQKLDARLKEKLKARSAYEIDKSTFADLAFDETLLAGLNKRLSSPYSEMILRHQMQNPALNPESIVRRQKAIGFLSDNPKLLDQLDELIKKSSADFFTIHSIEGAGQPDITIGQWLRIAGLNDGIKGAFYGSAIAYPQMIGMLPMAIMMGNPKGQLISQHNHVLGAAQGLLSKGMKMGKAAKGIEGLPEELVSLFKLLRREDPQMKKGLRYYGWAGVTRIKQYLDWLLPINLTFYPSIRKLKKSAKEAAAYIEAMSDLEIMVRMAQIKRSSPEEFIFPTIEQNTKAESKLVIENGHFPHFKIDDADSVPNSVSFNSLEDQILLMTGPNSGGKSTALRTVAHLTVMAQLGFPVPAKRMELTPLRLITNMQTEDNIAEGTSLFRSEIRRGKDVLDAINSDKRYLLLLDEIFKGTDHEQHQAAELTMLRHILNSDKLTFFSTHDRQLRQYLGEVDGIRYVHVDDDGSFMLKDGQSTTRNAAEIMQQEGLPQQYIDDFIRTFDEVAPDDNVRRELLRPNGSSN
jgi:DNA mismatch repair ATPase MutS